jgi:hypothetical protein
MRFVAKSKDGNESRRMTFPATRTALSPSPWARSPFRFGFLSKSRDSGGSEKQGDGHRVCAL